MSAETLRDAYAVHLITAFQSEWPLFTRELERDIVPAARELGVGVVPYSPLGRGELTGALEITAEDDFRRNAPRFQRENREHNLRLVERLTEIANELGCTPAQLALAWLLHQGDDVVPIRGTTRIRYLDENAGAVDIALSDERLRELEELFPPGAAAGDR